jgi:hypothetical protein
VPSRENVFREGEAQDETRGAGECFFSTCGRAICRCLRDFALIKKKPPVVDRRAMGDQLRAGCGVFHAATTSTFSISAMSVSSADRPTGNLSFTS